MSIFPFTPLGDLIEMRSGGTPSRKVPRFWNGSYPWVSPKDMKQREIETSIERISEVAFDETGLKRIPSNSVLIVVRGMILAHSIPVCLNRAEVAINQDVKALICGNKLEPAFLRWFLEARASDLLAKVSFAGHGTRRIDTKDLREFLIPRPPLDEQRRIVDILNRAASIQRLRDQANAKLRALIPALFIKVFGDPLENPMGWEVRPLGEVALSTQYGTSTKAMEGGDGVPMLRMGNVDYGGHLDTSNLKYVMLSDEGNEKYELRAGDILFNRTNSKDLVGKTGLWDGRFDAVHASYFIRVRVDDALVSPTYVWAYMNSAPLKRRLFDMARGAIGQANINAKELRSLPLPLPPLDLQTRYSEIVASARGIATTAETATETASALSASLMALLFGDAA